MLSGFDLYPRWVPLRQKRPLRQNFRFKNAFGNQQFGNSFVNKIRMRQSGLIINRKTNSGCKEQKGLR